MKIKIVFYIQHAVEVHDVSIQEGKELVKERIILDKQRGLQIYHTGEHAGRRGVTELIDSNIVSWLFIIDYHRRIQILGEMSEEMLKSKYCAAITSP